MDALFDDHSRGTAKRSGPLPQEEPCTHAIVCRCPGRSFGSVEPAECTGSVAWPDRAGVPRRETQTPPLPCSPARRGEGEAAAARHKTGRLCLVTTRGGLVAEWSGERGFRFSGACRWRGSAALAVAGGPRAHSAAAAECERPYPEKRNRLSPRSAAGPTRRPDHRNHQARVDHAPKRKTAGPVQGPRSRT